ncbi:MAG: ABC transporter permease [Phycisphaerae bacterium]|nr:ABC transporter permease [Phycisphaerae bacterium]
MEDGLMAEGKPEGLSRKALALVAAFGDFWRFAGAALWWTPSSARTRQDLALLMPQFHEIGARSVPIVGITGLFVGMVLAVQTVVQFEAVGLENYLGSVINLSVVRELGPVLAGVMLAGRVGGAMTAELGTMNVTEQIDALRSMGTNPIRYLVVPRFLACLMLTPLLTCYADLMGVFGGYAISCWVFGVSENPYWRYTAQSLETWDIMVGLAKSVLFGGSIAMVACYKGFGTRGGAEGVGRACTEAFVISFVAILTFDFFMAVLFKGIYELVWGFKSVF